MALMAIFGDYLGDGFQLIGRGHFALFLGFLFLPRATLFLAWIAHRTAGDLSLWHWAAFGILACFDLRSNEASNVNPTELD